MNKNYYLPKVSIIILNYNRTQDTIQCLYSLKKINYPNFDIIVVDNCSRDNFTSQIKQHFPDITVIRNSKNYGFAEGNNIGIRKAIEGSSDYILILNNDTIVGKNFLSFLVDEMEKNPSTAIAGPLILYFNNKDVIWSAGGTTSFWRPRNLYQDKVADNRLKTTTDIDYLSGCCLLIKTNYLLKIGLFDSDFFLYSEDVDLCIRAKEAGFQILFVPQAKIWHKISLTAGGEYSPLAKYYGIRNRLFLLKKHGSNLDKILFYCIILPIITVKNIFILLKNLKSLSAFFRGLVDGLKGQFGKVYSI